METLTATLDALILAWLVFTWVYEGHHKRCKVDFLVTCSSCGQELKTETQCAADRRNH